MSTAHDTAVSALLPQIRAITAPYADQTAESRAVDLAVGEIARLARAPTPSRRWINSEACARMWNRIPSGSAYVRDRGDDRTAHTQEEPGWGDRS